MCALRYSQPSGQSTTSLRAVFVRNCLHRPRIRASPRLNRPAKNGALRAAAWVCFQSSGSRRARRSPGTILQTPRRRGLLQLARATLRAAGLVHGAAGPCLLRPTRRALRRQPSASIRQSIGAASLPPEMLPPSSQGASALHPSSSDRPRDPRRFLRSCGALDSLAFDISGAARLQRGCPDDLVRLRSRQNG